MLEGLPRTRASLRNTAIEFIGVRVIVDEELSQRLRIANNSIGMTGNIKALGGTEGYEDQPVGIVLLRVDLTFYDRLCEKLGAVYISPTKSRRSENLECKRPVNPEFWIASGVLVPLEESKELNIINSSEKEVKK